MAAGYTIAQIDAKDAQKSVRDAESSLASTKLSLEKLKIENSRENMDAESAKTYSDALNTVSDTFLDLAVVVPGLEDIFEENNLSDNAAAAVSRTAQAYRDKARDTYHSAEKAFNENKKNYATISNDSPAKDIEGIVQETYETTKLLSDAIKNTITFVSFMKKQKGENNSSIYASVESSLAEYTDTINGHLSSLLASSTSIKNNEDSSQSSDLDIQSAELSVTQKENALQDAKDKLADYFIRAPYAGTIANMTVKKADSVSSSTVIATLITDKQIAEISLNEVDVAKIKIGEKADLTFDAVPDLTITGSVEEIDSIGAVAQGVVTYNVKISFDTEDTRIKPAMSVSAAIITDMKQDVLVVPNSAVKSARGESYVEVFTSPLPDPTDGSIGSISEASPERIPVEVGLSNDSQTEIISGLKEGDEIVTRIISGSAAAAATPAPSLFGGGGNRATTGGAVRVQAR